jgi:hypothetical protein
MSVPWATASGAGKTPGGWDSERMKFAPPPCEWKLDTSNDCEIWESACGETWQFIDGGPTENRARFCHGCGGRIVLTRTK